MNSVPFYERLGFSKVSEEQMELGGDIRVPVMMMQKVLKNALNEGSSTAALLKGGKG